jgi:ArsR family transcriptional regulator
METKTALKALAALANESRLAIFRHLVECGPEGAFAGAIAEQLGIPAPTLSFHLKEMLHAELLESAQQSRNVRYTANLEVVQRLVRYLTENCCGGDLSRCAPVCVPVPSVKPKAVKATAKARSSGRAR